MIFYNQNIPSSFQYSYYDVQQDNENIQDNTFTQFTDNEIPHDTNSNQNNKKRKNENFQIGQRTNLSNTLEKESDRSMITKELIIERSDSISKAFDKFVLCPICKFSFLLFFGF